MNCQADERKCRVWYLPAGTEDNHDENTDSKNWRTNISFMSDCKGRIFWGRDVESLLRARRENGEGRSRIGNEKWAVTRLGRVSLPMFACAFEFLRARIMTQFSLVAGQHLRMEAIRTFQTLIKPPGRSHGKKVTWDKIAKFYTMCPHSIQTSEKLPFYLKLAFTMEPIEMLSLLS